MKGLQAFAAAGLLLAVLASAFTSTAHAEGTITLVSGSSDAPSSTSLYIHIEEQGWAAGYQPYKSTVVFSLRTRCWNTVGWDYFDYTITTDNYGNVSGSIYSCDNGSYSELWLKAPRWTANYTSYTAAYSFSWDAVVHSDAYYKYNYAGDVNNDNVVNVTDYNALRASYGLCSPNPYFNPYADFNMDGCVTTVDYSYLQANFGHAAGPPSW